MERGAKPAKAKVEARPHVARKSRKTDGSKSRQLEQRLTEALEQQTATSEILRVISSSRTNAQPVFDTMAANALRLCDARFSAVFRFDGELIHTAAFQNLTPEGTAAFLTAYPCRPSRGGTTQRAILTGRIVHMPDIREDPEYVYQDVAQKADYRSVLSVPILRDGRVIGTITVYREAARLFPDAQIELLKTFADQAVIAIENVRLFTELEARNRDLTEALEQQTATSEILRVISQSQTDVQPVFEAIAAAALKLCDATSGGVYPFDGELIHVGALAVVNPEGADALRKLFPRPPSRDMTATRAILTRDVATVPDVLADPDFAFQAAALAAGFRSVLAVPLMRDETAIGAIAVGRPEPGRFPDQQIALLQTFADQAVIAIENVRLFTELEARNRDLTISLEQQTATSEILRVISRSQTDVQPVFDTIVAAAMKLCSANSANVCTSDGEWMHLSALVTANPEWAEAIRSAYPRRLGSRDIAASRAVLTRSIVTIPDVMEDPEHGMPDTAVAGGFRSILSVPLIREGTPIGAIAVGRPEPGPFPDEQVALLQTFADQAVIAIENVRLFTEVEARKRDLTEALEHQTATSEILRVISSSPNDVQPVFEIIGERATRLCDAQIGLVSRVEGDQIHLAALHGVSREGTEAIGRYFPMRLDAELTTARAIRGRSVVHTFDVLADPKYEAKDAAIAGTYRGVLAVPMFREGQVIGAIFVARANPGRFADSKVELLKTFADQAVIAIENVRLFNELKTRTAQLTHSVGELKALGEVGQAVSSTLDLETVLNTIVSRATELTGMDGGAIYEYDEMREQFYLHATDKLPDELVKALRAAPIRKGEGALGQLAVTGELVQIRDIGDERAYQSRVRKILMRLGHRSLLAVPLLREDHLLGGLVMNRKSAGEFAPEVIELLKTFATQSALAIQNARLFREIEDKSRQLEVASQHKSEFLANMSHELRTPLNAIIGFSEVLSERMFGEINDKQAEYLSDILESGRHLLSLINDILDLSKIEAGRMELDPTDFDLPTAIENTLILVRERAQRRGITLGRTVDQSLGMIRADERKLKQVLLNLLSNALKFTPEGGQIDVRARAHNGEAEISVADTGEGIAPEDQEAVFEEFRQVGKAAKKVEGTGLGLAISRKFIELHGGRIWVKSQLGIGSTFAFTLPLTIGQLH
jgi:GAF domain-containing protein